MPLPNSTGPDRVPEDDGDDFELMADDEPAPRAPDLAPTRPPADAWLDADAEDGDEYELEAPDQAIIEGERLRAEHDIRKASAAIDINDAYKRLEDDPLNLPDEGFQYRFQIKHLLIATGLIAVFISLAKLQGAAVAAITLTFMLLVTGHLYISWQERARERRADRMRRADRIRRQGVADGLSEAEIEEEIGEELDDEPDEKVPVRLQFSLKHLMIAMTVTPLLLGLIVVTGGAQVLAMLIGLVALAGLIANVLGYEPPPNVAIGWWGLLLVYVLYSVVAPALSTG
ncbi:hypothetical protein Pla175_08750 [Pirellulimonas nuda]|uniref:Uncharacterized protein n=1 Tax=Pirellulimonas nuda TaxID=2528009 RepID=A0A518D7Q6_9BACT|nr:hypothetical protein [Pirellulimonas nuda]QDU87513.1 hypothetical protein Pla175_08750 [Pirellulimonas nuda]